MRIYFFNKEWSICEFPGELFDLGRGICVDKCRKNQTENKELNVCVKNV